MTRDHLIAFVRQVSAAWLVVRVHADAFRMFPARYLTAVKWRVLGKRVRARGQLAPLLSRSRHAYEYWTLSEERHLTLPRSVTGPRITALVQAGEASLVDVTLKSIAACDMAVMVVDKGASALIQLAEQQQFAQPHWFMPVIAGDEIAAHAAATYRAMIEEAGTECTVIYADDDSLDSCGRRKDPCFKPDWNRELQVHHDMLTGACILLAEARALKDAAQHEDWMSALVQASVSRGKVGHVHAVLHHRRSRPAAPQRVQSLAIADNLPPLSVIIPTRNRGDLLRTCITGLRATRYTELEIIVANNDSDDPETLSYLRELGEEGVTILGQPGPFNYPTINNNAVAAARGELICLLNNDIEVLAPDWLEIMATQAMRPEVGAVGAQLLYPDGRIQHAGVVIGVGNAAGHAHRFLRTAAEGYFRRHALPQYVSAVTAACLVVRRDRFLAVGGLDEENFAVAFNDVDLCLRLNQRGWQSFYEPRAVLVHHESVSRGFDTDPVGAARFAKELGALQRIWRTNEIVDPYHHPMLSRASEQFALDLTSVMVQA